MIKFCIPYGVGMGRPIRRTNSFFQGVLDLRSCASLARTRTLMERGADTHLELAGSSHGGPYCPVGNAVCQAVHQAGTASGTA